MPLDSVGLQHLQSRPLASIDAGSQMVTGRLYQTRSTVPDGERDHAGEPSQHRPATEGVGGGGTESIQKEIDREMVG